MIQANDIWLNFVKKKPYYNGEIMNKKLITLAVIIILDIILLAASEKLPTIDYLSLGEWNTFSTPTGQLQLDFRSDKTLTGFFISTDKRQYPLKGSYSVKNKTVYIKYSTSAPGLNISKAQLQYLENNPDFNYALKFDDFLLFNTNDTAEKGKKIQIKKHNSVLLNKIKLKLPKSAQCTQKPVSETAPFTFKIWSEKDKTWFNSSTLSPGYSVTLIARTERKTSFRDEKDFWYYVSFTSRGPDDLEPQMCWIHGSHLDL